jgi:hypothetical protein
MNWYYVSAGKQTGPVDDAQLEGLARTGQIQMDTLVWREGMAEWQPYSTVAPPGMAAPAAAPAAPAFSANEVVCAECNRIFPKDETIPFGTVRVCAGGRAGDADGGTGIDGDIHTGRAHTRIFQQFN